MKILKSMGLKNTILNRKTSDERNKQNDIENISSAYDLCSIWKTLKMLLSYQNSRRNCYKIYLKKQQGLKGGEENELNDELKLFLFCYFNS